MFHPIFVETFHSKTQMLNLILAIHQTVFEVIQVGDKLKLLLAKNQENNDESSACLSKFKKTYCNGSKDLSMRGNRAVAHIYRDPIFLVLAVW